MKIILLILVNRDHNSEIMTKFAVYWVRTARRFFLRKKDGDSLYDKTDGDSSYARRQEIHLTQNWAHIFFTPKHQNYYDRTTTDSHPAEFGQPLQLGR